MKYFICGFLLSVLILSCKTEQAWRSTSVRGRLVFSDEFNLGRLDTAKWSTLPYWKGQYHPGFPQQWYGPDNFEFTDSTIKLIAKNDTLKDGNLLIPFSIGLLDNSKVMDRKFGYFEIRCKIPSGEAMWPAFWLVSRHSWPPEIDIFEFYTSKDPSVPESNVHWAQGENREMKVMKHRVYKPDSIFHVYGFEWRKDVLKWFIDGKLVRSEKKLPEVMKYPMHVTINTGIHDKYRDKLQLPQAFEVDYVRVYEY